MALGAAFTLDDDGLLAKRLALLTSVLIALILIIISCVHPTTGDTGDSITHYLYSRYAWSYKSYLFNLWAKPVFTFLSSPFSQFGMTGMKIYNSLVVATGIYLACRIAIHYRLRYWFFVPVMILFSPVFGVSIFSGLTEFTYALFLLASTWFAIKERYALAAVITAFIPFVRNEGVLTIMLMAALLIWRKQWRHIPWLASGYIFLGLIGALVMRFPLHWALTTKTYDPTGSPYAAGEFWTFIKHLRYVMDWPNVILICIGLISLIGLVYRFFRRDPESHIWLILIFGNFIGFYIGHAILHELGRFGSMGLPRVLFSVVPFAALIGVHGLQHLLEPHKEWIKWIVCLYIIVIAAYPFLPRPASHLWSPSVLDLPENDLVDDEIIPYYQDRAFAQMDTYFNAPYLTFGTGRNVLDQWEGKAYMNAERIRQLPVGSIYIWDQWYSPVEGKITKDLLLTEGFEQQHCADMKYWKGHFEFCIFEKKG